MDHDLSEVWNTGQRFFSSVISHILILQANSWKTQSSRMLELFGYLRLGGEILGSNVMTHHEDDLYFMSWSIDRKDLYATWWFVPLPERFERLSPFFTCYDPLAEWFIEKLALFRGSCVWSAFFGLVSPLVLHPLVSVVVRSKRGGSWTKQRRTSPGLWTSAGNTTARGTRMSPPDWAIWPACCDVKVPLHGLARDWSNGWCGIWPIRDELDLSGPGAILYIVVIQC